MCFCLCFALFVCFVLVFFLCHSLIQWKVHGKGLMKVENIEYFSRARQPFPLCPG